MNQERKGIAAGIACYLVWGVLPLYWKLLSNVSSVEIICHRIIWCCLFSVLACLVLRLDFVALLRSPRARRFLIPAAAVITVNWSVYIFAVEIDRIVETAIGYYLNPLVTILLGVAVFHERLSAAQKIAVALSAVGIAFFTVGYGRFPWIAVLLAASFSAYGAIKKKGGYPAVEAIAFENLVALVPAIAVALALAAITGQHGFLGDTSTAQGWGTTALLVFGGLLTAVPLILFAWAVNRIPLTVLGFIQFLSPTISLLIGVFVNGEPFTTAHFVCFCCIWTGLVLVVAEPLVRSRRQKQQ